MTPNPVTGGRDGFALVLSILLLLALAVLSAGMVAVATHEARIAGGVAARLRARAAAEAAVRRTIASWSTRRERGLPPGSGRSLTDGMGARVRIERLDSALFLVTATGSSPAAGGAARASAGALVRILDTRRIALLSAPAAATIRGPAVLHGGVVSGVDACGGRPPMPGIISPDLTRTGGTLAGDPPAHAESPPPAILDRLPFDALDAVRPDRAVRAPEPLVRSGACVPGPWNWATSQAGHPCRAPVLIHVRGDLTLRGGRGFGVLVVDGDLTATGGFVFDGLILVRGRALLDDAVLRGGLHADRLELRAGELRYDACRLSAALRVPAFDAPFRPGARWWVPTF